MDIYQNSSRWKIYLGIAAIFIVGVSLFVSNYLANQIAEGERKKVEMLSQAFQAYNNQDGDGMDFVFHALEENKSIPVMAVDATGEIMTSFVKNFGEKEGEIAYLENQLAQMRASGRKPIILDNTGIGTIYIYYKNTWLFSALQYFPILNLLLVASFIMVAYHLFNSSRQSEQNRVWVGMAKETAHQLGTPISGILAWIEHLKMMKEGDEETEEIVVELTKDVQRLELVADRFSKIGSTPELQEADIYEVIDRNFKYMEKRASRRVNFEYPPKKDIIDKVNINNHLFDWVVENLLRNALDSMGGSGTISARIYLESSKINIEISDTGKGIPSSKFKTVFKPGFTTKKRGWGLGLSLTKRIIESYHSGKIFVKKSVVGEGTTFCIQLPKL